LFSSTISTVYLQSGQRHEKVIMARRLVKLECL
jgi:hypothetical protein